MVDSNHTKNRDNFKSTYWVIPSKQIRWKVTHGWSYNESDYRILYLPCRRLLTFTQMVDWQVCAKEIRYNISATP